MDKVIANKLNLPRAAILSGVLLMLIGLGLLFVTLKTTYSLAAAYEHKCPDHSAECPGLKEDEQRMLGFSRASLAVGGVGFGVLIGGVVWLRKEESKIEQQLAKSKYIY